MCGRFALYSDPFSLAQRFGTKSPADWQPRYNIAPSQTIPLVREEDKERRIALARWGLIPHWAKDKNIGYSTINARVETVAEKPVFRQAFRRRRCLIPADGYFEWQAKPNAKAKQPWFIMLADRQPMALAGLWERWKSPDGIELDSCSIIVTAANDLMRPIHDRMPVILPPEDWDAWLEPDAKDLQYLHNLLKPYPAGAMAAWPVSTQVNNPQNDVAGCVEVLN
jgi:putative SOS response-associated peptidase YedK